MEATNQAGTGTEEPFGQVGTGTADSARTRAGRPTGTVGEEHQQQASRKPGYFASTKARHTGVADLQVQVQECSLAGFGSKGTLVQEHSKECREAQHYRNEPSEFTQSRPSQHLLRLQSFPWFQVQAPSFAQRAVHSARNSLTACCWVYGWCTDTRSKSGLRRIR